jgi:hypothetical protein
MGRAGHGTGAGVMVAPRKSRLMVAADHLLPLGHIGEVT